MTSETINGLHSCKPGNEPVVGQVKTFAVEQRISKTGKPWLKIKNETPEYGGEPYTVIAVTPVKNFKPDPHGNISFNLEIEPAHQPVEGLPPPRIAGVNAPQAPPASFNGLDERQRAIIRQHSQSMALEVLKLKVTLNELIVEDLTPAKLRSLADYFDQDVLGAAQ